MSEYLLSDKTATALQKRLREEGNRGEYQQVPVRSSSLLDVGDFAFWEGNAPFYYCTPVRFSADSFGWTQFATGVVTERRKKALTPGGSLIALRTGDISHGGYSYATFETACSACGNALSSSSSSSSSSGSSSRSSGSSSHSSGSSVGTVTLAVCECAGIAIPTTLYIDLIDTFSISDECAAVYATPFTNKPMVWNGSAWVSNPITFASTTITFTMSCNPLSSYILAYTTGNSCDTRTGLSGGNLVSCSPFERNWTGIFISNCGCIPGNQMAFKVHA